MNKAQALYQFWSQFDLPVYDENSVPDNAKMPYITYETQFGSIDDVLSLSASIWTRGKSWQTTTDVALMIENRIDSMQPIKIDNGYLFITKGTPFLNRMGDGENYNVKRALLNINAQFLTN